MESLTPGQREQLRSLAHHLKPLVFVGHQGVTDALIAAVDENLTAHELIKVKFNDHKDEKRALSAEIVERSESAMVGILGNVLTLYRPHPQEERRRIHL
ncbi:MAG: ribosome assembly RNA-binding protein YhbY [Candidatus Hydrogenedentes bacterium]|nr:ribosome assembly RNA-binding protein YhbY [Candidatus Hydrogenedentota bacterium]